MHDSINTEYNIYTSTHAWKPTPLSSPYTIVLDEPHFLIYQIRESTPVERRKWNQITMLK